MFILLTCVVISFAVTLVNAEGKTNIAISGYNFLPGKDELEFDLEYEGYKSQGS